jgi:hypothetical protein
MPETALMSASSAVAFCPAISLFATVKPASTHSHQGKKRTIFFNVPSCHFELAQ